MKTLTIRLPDELYEKLKKASEERGVRMATLIKMVLSEWLRERQVVAYQLTAATYDE